MEEYYNNEEGCLQPVNSDNNSLELISNMSHGIDGTEMVALADATQNVVSHISGIVGNVAATMHDMKMISAQVEVETRRIDHALDCLMVKAQHNHDMYKSTLPLLEKNFAAMQARMDTIMNRALDLICEDVSDAALAKQENIMKMIEMTNNSINGLVSKLMPNQ